MKQEDKELLLQDLCARLPYGVKGIEANSICLLDTSSHFKSLIKNIEYKIGHLGFKPYLFPISSMTEEQKKEFSLITCDLNDSDYWRDGYIIYSDDKHQLNAIIDFYHKYHFDYRGLIPKGLAIDCTNLNIY